jgi:hypothetical protein
VSDVQKLDARKAQEAEEREDWPDDEAKYLTFRAGRRTRATVKGLQARAVGHSAPGARRSRLAAAATTIHAAA